jgi:hypothetical protein
VIKWSSGPVVECAAAEARDMTVLRPTQFRTSGGFGSCPKRQPTRKPLGQSPARTPQSGTAPGFRFALLLVLAGLGVGFAATPSDLFVRGNAAYEAGDFAGAVALYDSAAVSGASPALLFNRGNAKFKLGSIGKSIADYSRAYVLAPTDKDIRNNLAFARQYRPDKTLTLENPLVRMFTDILRVLSYSTTRMLAGFFFFAALAVLALLFITGNRWYGLSALVPGILFVYCLAANLSWGVDVNSNRAVVVVPEITLRSGPGAEYKEIAIVHDGLEVVVRERRPGFVLVQAPGGEGGWAESAAVEQIFPR